MTTTINIPHTTVREIAKQIEETAASNQAAKNNG